MFTREKGEGGDKEREEGEGVKERAREKERKNFMCMLLYYSN